MIRKALSSECQAIAAFMKRFEEDSKLIRVDVDYTARMHAERIDRGTGVIFLLCDDATGNIQGGLGGICGPSMISDEKIAVETFWYVAPEHRGRGLKLMIAFEEWAKRQGCQKVAMVHLADSHSDELSLLYVRRGYKLIETHFEREVQS
jgi:GNAT superfamily N-acetyltransferase